MTTKVRPTGHCRDCAAPLKTWHGAARGTCAGCLAQAVARGFLSMEGACRAASTAVRQRLKQEAFQRLLAERREKAGPRPAMVRPEPPRYDEIFAEGVAWLDAEAGGEP